MGTLGHGGFGPVTSRPDGRSLGRSPRQFATKTDGQNGAAAVLVAGALFLLMGFVALGVDGGNLYQERRSAQNAADQAALAAAFTACQGGTEAQAIAAGEAAAAANNYDGSTADVVVTITRESPNRYKAVVARDIDASFGQVIGANDLGTGASAIVSCSGGGVGSGTTLHAHATGCPGPELYIDGDSVEVNGGSHSNGTIYLTGEDVTLYGGTTYGEDPWEAPADNEVVDPVQTQTTTSAAWPIEYNLADYQPGGHFATSLTSAGLYHTHVADLTLAGPVMAGIHYIPGNLTIQDNIIVTAVGGETGVTFVATGWIRTLPDTLSLTHYSGTDNKGLLFFANLGSGGCDDTLAIESQTDHADYEGVLYAPNGKILMRSDGAQAVALWGNFVELRGDPHISLNYPAAAVDSGDPQLTFEK